MKYLQKESPDHHDADIVIKLYDLRREHVMREARTRINREFWPTSFDDIVAITSTPDHPLNAPFRQVSGYWDMVYGMAKHGIVHSDFLMETNGEGIFLYARIEPYLAQLREVSSPRAFLNSQWIVENSDMGRTYLDMFRQRVAKALAARKKG